MFRLRQRKGHLERPLRISSLVLDDIRRSVGSLAPETGGMLGGDPIAGVVTHFRFDREASRTSGTYSPDCRMLNRVLADEWNPAGVRLMGFVHSHPTGFRNPSRGDEMYARRILGAIPEADFIDQSLAAFAPDASPS